MVCMHTGWLVNSIIIGNARDKRHKINLKHLCLKFCEQPGRVLRRLIKDD